MKRLSFLLPLALAACSILPQTPQFALYAPTANFDAATAAIAEPVAWRLALLRPTASGLLNTPRILVWPSSNTIEVYPRAQWSQSPPVLVGDALLQALEADGRIIALQRSGAGLERDFELATELRAFQLELTGGPQAVVRIKASLVRQPQGRLVASHVFEAALPAAGQEIGDAVSALGACLEHVLPQIVEWSVIQAEAAWRDAPEPEQPVS